MDQYTSKYENQFTTVDEIERFGDDTIGNFNRSLIHILLQSNLIENTNSEVFKVETVLSKFSTCGFYVDYLKRIAQSDPSHFPSSLWQKIPTSLRSSVPLFFPFYPYFIIQFDRLLLPFCFLYSIIY